MISNQTCQVRVGKCNSVRFIVENFDILSSVICKLVRTPLSYMYVMAAASRERVDKVPMKINGKQFVVLF